MSRTLLWIFFCFGLIAGAATMVLSFHTEAGTDFARFLRVVGLIAWGISAYYCKLIMDARRLEARHVDVNDWPPGLRTYCDPRSRMRLVWKLVWIIVLAFIQAVL
jgi:hypothetical protein